MQTRLEFNNKCTACGAARRKEDLVYSKEELKPYCTNINVCVVDHPNSYNNVMANQGNITDMLGFKEAQVEFNLQLMANATEEEKQIIKLTQSPTTIRIDEFDLAEHVILYKEQHKHATLTEALREIVREHKNLTGDPDAERDPNADFIIPIIPAEKEELPPEQITTETLGDTGSGREVF